LLPLGRMNLHGSSVRPDFTTAFIARGRARPSIRYGDGRRQGSADREAAARGYQDLIEARVVLGREAGAAPAVREAPGSRAPQPTPSTSRTFALPSTSVAYHCRSGRRESNTEPRAEARLPRPSCAKRRGKLRRRFTNAEAPTASVATSNQTYGGGGLLLCQSLRYPDLDDRLPRDTQAASFLVQRLDHPLGEVDVHTPNRLPRAASSCQLQEADNVLSGIKTLVKIMCLHTVQPLQV